MVPLVPFSLLYHCSLFLFIVASTQPALSTVHFLPTPRDNNTQQATNRQQNGKNKKEEKGWIGKEKNNHLRSERLYGFFFVRYRTKNSAHTIHVVYRDLHIFVLLSFARLLICVCFACVDCLCTVICEPGLARMFQNQLLMIALCVCCCK